ncbi:MAG: hypothetical protein HUU35_02035, partial [Armatimonadetes bacterium]|nr:hypothetical protein [Armatimonadota bacterium]
MNAVVAVIATLLALAAWPLIRRLWLGPLGTGLANVAARGALSELAERHRALSSAAELLIRPTDDPGEVLAGAGLASESLADNLLAALSDPPAEVWGRLAERSGDPAERVWLAHEAALRGATAAVGVVAGPQPLVQAELAVSRAAVGGNRPAAYHLLDQHGPGLPLVSRLLLQQRLARAAG